MQHCRPVREGMPGCSRQSDKPCASLVGSVVKSGVVDSKHSEGSRKAAFERGQNASKHGKR